MVVLATLATVIASQAVISGAYSLTQQAIQLGLLPRMRIIHTWETDDGPDLHAAHQLAALRRVMVLALLFEISANLAPPTASR